MQPLTIIFLGRNRWEFRNLIGSRFGHGSKGVGMKPNGVVVIRKE
jgi:hypothetical protein